MYLYIYIYMYTVSAPDQFKTPEKFIHLWLHESERVYGDRLVSYEDLARYICIHVYLYVYTYICIYVYGSMMMIMMIMMCSQQKLKNNLPHVKYRYNTITQAQHKKVFPSYNVARFYSGDT
jgi:hypothetical protein